MTLFLIGISLLLIFEGILPFLSPRLWRSMMQQIMMQSDQALRTIGFTSMLIGLALLYWVH